MQQEGTKKRSNGKKRNFIPRQNTHDLLVGTLSIGIPSSKGVQKKSVKMELKMRNLPFSQYEKKMKKDGHEGLKDKYSPVYFWFLKAMGF